jgi:hypothetical protein
MLLQATTFLLRSFLICLKLNKAISGRKSSHGFFNKKHCYFTRLFCVIHVSRLVLEALLMGIKKKKQKIRNTEI